MASYEVATELREALGADAGLAVGLFKAKLTLTLTLGPTPSVYGRWSWTWTR